MMSFFMFAIVITALFAAALSVLTVSALAAERRADATRLARVRANLARMQASPTCAAMYTLADRRKAVATDVTVERRAA